MQARIVSCQMPLGEVVILVLNIRYIGKPYLVTCRFVLSHVYFRPIIDFFFYPLSTANRENAQNVCVFGNHQTRNDMVCV
eukprot:snap_masked-scaffold_3-processed-gene-14.27-mRNA-1 protein AED:1.00 eAED:1.00 QI:0/0/0/0/1/1/2/0/79